MAVVLKPAVLLVFTPDVFHSGTYDVVIEGDTYPCATDDTLLHLGYEALTALELDLTFAVKVLTLIQSNEFLDLLKLPNTPETFVKVFRTGSSSGISWHAVRTFTIATGSFRRKQWRRSGGADRRVGSRVIQLIRGASAW